MLIDILADLAVGVHEQCFCYVVSTGPKCSQLRQCQEHTGKEGRRQTWPSIEAARQGNAERLCDFTH